jgi:hypothetical protein
MDKRPISTQSNPRRRIFIPKLIAGTVGVAVAYFVVLALEPSVGLSRSPVLTALAIAGLWLVAVVVMYRRSWHPLKSVSVDGAFLYVCEYGSSDEAAIPLSDVVRVTQWRGNVFRPVTVHLRSPSRFGDRIKFQPAATGELGLALAENRIVAELRALARSSRAKA